MPTTNLNISVVERRMLRQTEAAIYAGLPMKHFKNVCPVSPIELQPGTLLWDRRDLDRWIDGIKSGAQTETREAFLDRL